MDNKCEFPSKQSKRRLEWLTNSVLGTRVFLSICPSVCLSAFACLSACMWIFQMYFVRYALIHVVPQTSLNTNRVRSCQICSSIISLPINTRVIDFWINGLFCIKIIIKFQISIFLDSDYLVTCNGDSGNDDKYGRLRTIRPNTRFVGSLLTEYGSGEEKDKAKTKTKAKAKSKARRSWYFIIDSFIYKEMELINFAKKINSFLKQQITTIALFRVFVIFLIKYFLNIQKKFLLLFCKKNTFAAINKVQF